MGMIQDDIGVWNQLGSLQPELNNWLKFPVPSNGANNTFRLEVVSLTPDKITSYLLFRSRFTTERTDQVEQAIRIYPKSHIEQKLLFQLQLNKELFDRTIYIRSIEVKKMFIRPKYLGINSDVPYTIRLEELW